MRTITARCTLTERSPRTHVFEQNQRHRERPPGDGPRQQKHEPDDDDPYDDGRGPELRRMLRKVVVDVVVAQQPEIRKTGRKQKRYEADKDTQHHIRHQSKNVERMRRTESQSAPRVERHALRHANPDSHQARRFHGGDRDNQRSA